MRWRQLGAGALAVVAMAAVGVGWFEDVPALTADDAVQATQEAFRSAGIDATVEPVAIRSTYASRTREPVDVWAVRATVRAEPVELQLARSGAHPVAIDDRTLDGTTYVLSELEYGAVARGVDDPSLARQLRRNIALTTAAVLVVGLTIALAAFPKERRP